MKTTKPISFKSLLKDAKRKGCVNVKIKVCDSCKEDMEGSTPIEKFYKEVLIKTRIDSNVVISKILMRIDDNTLIIRVALADGNTLIKGLK